MAFSTTCGMYDEQAKSTKEEVERASTGTETSNLKENFRGYLSDSIPKPTLYRNDRPGEYSLLFGVPLGDPKTNQDNVPKVMRMCMEEIENRGLDTTRIYSVSRSRRVSCFMFSVVAWYYIRRWSAAGQRIYSNDQPTN